MTQFQAVIDKMMDAVEWKEYERTPPLPDGGSNPFEGELYATHEGILSFGAGITLRCYQLSNGQRVFDAEDCHRFLGIELPISASPPQPS